MDNKTLIGWGIFVIIIWCFWIAFLVARKLKGEAFNMTRGDILGYLKR